MNGKHLPPLRIEPQEAIALFTHAKAEEWDIMSLLSFVYDTARIQGIREERAKRT